MREESLYAGFANIALAVDSVDIGKGLILRRVYAHLMSPRLLAFAPAPAGQPHPALWRAAEGGLSFDVHVELEVPPGELPGRMKQEDTIWWVAALLRLGWFPYLSVPLLSDQSLANAAHCEPAPAIRPFEIEPRLLSHASDAAPIISADQISWLAETWQEGAELLSRHPTFCSSVRAFDSCTVSGRTASSLLAVWGALEQLFSPSPGELRYRVSTNVAAYLEPSGPRRLALYKKMLELYNVRSTAAHTASDIDHGPLVETYVIMRNALVKMIDHRRIPNQSDFEHKLFCGDVDD